MRERETVYVGCYPWNSVDSIGTRWLSSLPESQQDIQDCLTCKRSACNNCKEKKYACNQMRQTDVRISMFMKLINAKKNRRQICDELGISRTTYYNYLNACGATASA